MAIRPCSDVVSLRSSNAFTANTVLEKENANPTSAASPMSSSAASGPPELFPLVKELRCQVGEV